MLQTMRSVAQDLGRQGAGPLVDGSVPTHLSPAVTALNASGNLQGSGIILLELTDTDDLWMAASYLWLPIAQRRSVIIIC